MNKHHNRLDPNIVGNDPEAWRPEEPVATDGISRMTRLLIEHLSDSGWATIATIDVDPDTIDPDRDVHTESSRRNIDEIVLPCLRSVGIIVWLDDSRMRVRRLDASALLPVEDRK